jgi:hypothetical protein
MSTFKTGGPVVDGVVARGGFSATYTDERYALGSTRVQKADDVGTEEHTDGTALGLKGDRTMIFVKADAAITIYDCCIIKAPTATTSFEVIQSDATADSHFHVVGVAQVAIAEDSYGWIVSQGECVVNAAAGLAAGELAGTHTGGQVEGTVATTEVAIGQVLSAIATPVSGTVRMRLRIPG